MGKVITLGGNRLGSGSRMKVALDNHERSTSNLSEKFFSSMAPGLLVPCYKNLVLPGDTWKIKIDAGIFTKPTLGPMFSTLKFEVHFFYAQFRLYNGALHNDALNAATKMDQFKFAKIHFNLENSLEALPISDNTNYTQHLEQDTFSKSSLNAYMGYPSLPFKGLQATPVEVEKFAVQYLMYADIFKNAYANKQEKLAYVMSADEQIQTVTRAEQGVIDEYFNNQSKYDPGDITISKDYQAPSEIHLGFANEVENLSANTGTGIVVYGTNLNDSLKVYIVNKSGNYSAPTVAQIAQPGSIRKNASGTALSFYITVEALRNYYANNSSQLITDIIQTRNTKNPKAFFIKIAINGGGTSEIRPVLKSFPLGNLDKIRRIILADNDGNAVQIKATAATKETNTINFLPLSINCDKNDNGEFKAKYPLVGLFAKTYQADIFNAWLSTVNIKETVTKTKVNVSNGYLSMDSLILGKKLFNLYTQTALSGGTTSDWRVAMWGIEESAANEVPIYLGGLSTEIYFQEVTNTAEGASPLGNLAGKGRFSKFKGGIVNLKAKEEGLIMAIASITPRIAYCQGEIWFGELDNMQQLHTDKLDGIGFQDILQREQAAWANALDAGATTWLNPATGKVPAWMWYRTSVDKVYGELAEFDKQNYMVFTRNYEANTLKGAQTQGGFQIKDNTTYIDPAKYNQNFAEASRDAQNFWVLIDFQIQCRRIGSTSIIPHA